MAISGRTVIVAPDFQVDPRLVLPPGVANVGYTTALNDIEGIFTDAGDAVSGSGPVITSTEAGTVNPGIPVPDSAVIISQTIRIVPGGGIVVDVEMEVTNSASSDSFDVRLAKL